MIFLQTTILISGNYGFFNVLTIVLCIPLFDDQFLPEQLRQRILSGKIQPEKGRAKRFIQTSALVVIGTLHIWMTKGFISRDIAGTRPSQERTTKEPPQWQSKLKKKNPDIAHSQLLWAFQSHDHLKARDRDCW